MITVQFKPNSGGTAFNIDAFSVIEDWFIDEEEFSFVDHSLGKDILAVYKKFEIEFGVLSSSDQNGLKDLKKNPYPQFIYNSTTYTIRIDTEDIKAEGAKMTIINITPES